MSRKAGVRKGLGELRQGSLRSSIDVVEMSRRDPAVRTGSVELQIEDAKVRQYLQEHDRVRNIVLQAIAKAQSKRS
jgi:hypothetical protein